MLNTKDHTQWERETMTQAYDKLSSKVWSLFNKDLTELTPEEADQVLEHLKTPTNPVVEAIHEQLIKELF